MPTASVGCLEGYGLVEVRGRGCCEAPIYMTEGESGKALLINKVEDLLSVLRPSRGAHVAPGRLGRLVQASCRTSTTPTPPACWPVVSRLFQAFCVPKTLSTHYFYVSALWLATMPSEPLTRIIPTWI